VGHTINFVQRKISHEQNSKSDKCKLYQIIRTNGGWCNWTMEIIAFFNCMNHTEARMKEQEFFLSLNANLNSVEPFPKKEKKEKKKVKKEVKVVKEEEKNVKEEEKEQVVIDSTNYKFNCLFCNITCNRKNDWDRHILTRKHINKETNTQQKIKTCFTCAFCDKEYKSRKGLWSHNKTCNATTQTIINQNIDMSQLVNEDKNKMIEILLKENMEYKNIFSIFIKEILSKKSIEEFLKKK
jgi:hypothetical protein